MVAGMLDAARFEFDGTPELANDRIGSTPKPDAKPSRMTTAPTRAAATTCSRRFGAGALCVLCVLAEDVTRR
jgi:hypothetical protein